MNLNQLQFEAEPFELETRMLRRPGTRPHRPGAPSRPQPPRRLRGRVDVRVGRQRVECPPCDGQDHACETALVLEGFAAGQFGLASHHQPMLQRLAAFLSRSGRRPRSIEVDAKSTSGNELRRAEAAARYLRTRVRSVAITTAASRSQGPERVEIRLCFPEQE